MFPIFWCPLIRSSLYLNFFGFSLFNLVFVAEDFVLIPQVVKIKFELNILPGVVVILRNLGKVRIEAMLPNDLTFKPCCQIRPVVLLDGFLMHFSIMLWSSSNVKIKLGSICRKDYSDKLMNQMFATNCLYCRCIIMHREECLSAQVSCLLPWCHESNVVWD